MKITFNGCNDGNCATLSRKSQHLTTNPDVYEYSQSIEQAFYFFEKISGIKYGDWILSYNGDVVIGARQWEGNIIDVPAMDSDGSDFTIGYIEAGVLHSLNFFKMTSLLILKVIFLSLRTISCIWLQALQRRCHFQKYLAWIEPIPIHLIL